MPRFSVLLFIAIACLGLEAGFWLLSNGSGDWIDNEPDGTVNTSTLSVTHSNTSPPASGHSASANHINPFSVTHDTEATDETDAPNSIAKLYQSAQKSESARKTLMDRYLNASDSDTKGILSALLSKLQTADVQDFAIRLAGSNDASQRKDGFALLESQGIKSQKVRELALQALATERDPDMLRHALATLQPTATATPENTAVLQQLQGLIQHDDPSVRAQAVNTLAGWDKAGESVNALQQALTDNESQVRWAAVDAIADNRIRSEGLKTALIDMVSNTNEASDLRLSAASTLEHFSLDKDEYARISQATRDMTRGEAGAM